MSLALYCCAVLRVLLLDRFSLTGLSRADSLKATDFACDRFSFSSTAIIKHCNLFNVLPAALLVKFSPLILKDPLHLSLYLVPNFLQKFLPMTASDLHLLIFSKSSLLVFERVPLLSLVSAKHTLNFVRGIVFVFRIRFPIMLSTILRHTSRIDHLDFENSIQQQMRSQF